MAATVDAATATARASLSPASPWHGAAADTALPCRARGVAVALVQRQGHRRRPGAGPRTGPGPILSTEYYDGYPGRA